MTGTHLKTHRKCRPLPPTGMRLILLTAMLLLGAVSGVARAQESAAQDPEGAKAFITDLADRAMAIWRDPTRTQLEREKGFRDLLFEGFDVDFLAKISLGRFARQMTREQYDEYMRLFPDYVVNKFANRIGEYSNQTIEIGEAVPAGTRDVFVRTTLVRPGAEPLAADWRVRKTKDGFRIVDVKVEGISMVISQRDEFAALIEKSGIEGLLEELRKGAAELAAKDAALEAERAARDKGASQ
ncbi:MAG: toluene tolerance protein [Rhodothalassiaceae bacterium]|nr:MAG: toluene tolerance protein [Rhodothalassiaceae bacterium]